MKSILSIACTALLALAAQAATIEIEERSVADVETGRDVEPLVLHAISPKHLGRRRDLHEQLGGMDGRNMDSFFYGSSKDGETFTFANMTIILNDGEQLVSMERFEGVTKSVECGPKMKLVFIDNTAFQSAIRAWDWVNEDATKSFVMITNHEGCGQDFQRVPYKISDVDYDEAAFTAHMTATEISWHEVEGRLILDYGQGLTVSNNTGLQRRVEKDVDYTFDMTHMLANPTNIFTQTFGGLELALNCVDCGVQGQFNIHGRIEASIGFLKIDLDAMYLEARPNNLQARLGLELAAKGETDTFTHEVNLVKMPIPGASFSIPLIFSIGATLEYDVGITAKASGEASITYGLIAKLKNTAVARLDIKNPGDSAFNDWDPDFEQIPFTASAQIKGEVSIYSQPGFAVGFTVLEKWGYNAALRMKLPEIKTELTLMASTEGVCGTPNFAGVQIVATVGLDLFCRIGPEDPNADPLFEKSVWQKSWPFYDQCFAIGGSKDPGAAPTLPAPATTAPVTPPVDTTAVPPPAGTTDIPPPAGTTDVPPPVDTTAVTPVDTTAVLPPAGTTDIPPPAGTTDVPPPAGTTDVPPPAGTTDVPPPAGTTDVPPPVDSTGVPPPLDTTAVTAPVDTTAVPPPTGTPDVPLPVDTTAVPPPAGTTDISPPVINTDIAPPSGTTDIVPPAGTTDIPPPAETTETLPIYSASGTADIHLAAETPLLLVETPWTCNANTSPPPPPPSGSDLSYTCGGDTWTWNLPSIPPTTSIPNQRYYDFTSPDSCTDWSISRANTYPAYSSSATTDQIYSAALFKSFLHHLATVENVSCPTLHKVFFAHSSAGANAYLSELGSLKHLERLSVVTGSVAAAKATLLTTTATTSTSSKSAKKLLVDLKNVAGAISYLSNSNIQTQMRSTKIAIERVLTRKVDKRTRLGLAHMHDSYFRALYESINNHGPQRVKMLAKQVGMCQEFKKAAPQKLKEWVKSVEDGTIGPGTVTV